MLKFSCPSCGKTITAPDAAAGKRAKCPGCQAPVQIPAAVLDGIQVLHNPEIVHDDFEVVNEPDIVEDFEVVAAPPVVRPKTAVTVRPKPREEDIPVVEAVLPARRKPRRDDDDEDDDYDDDFDDDEGPRRKRRRRGPSDGTPMGRSGYATCYNCGADAASKVGFTWWGGILGPAILSHVRCDRCGTTYNGRSGKSNSTAIAIYFGVGLAIGRRRARVRRHRQRDEIVRCPWSVVRCKELSDNGPRATDNGQRTTDKS